MDNGASSYRRFLDGDENGIVEIIRDYKDGLILYLDGFVGNVYTAEELAEETFIRIVVKKPGFSAKSKFKTWLYTIGRNVTIDHLRRASKISDIPVEDLRDVLRDEENLERSYLREERKIIVHKALKKLNTEYRQVIFLIYFEGFDNTQTAAVLKKSNRQIENLVYRAKIALKSELDKEGFHYEDL